MKNFQNKFSAILLFAVMALFVSCTEDYQSDIDSLEDRVTALETEVDALQSALDSGAVITAVSSTTTGTTVTLSDGSSFTITNGADGDDGDAGAPGAAAPVWTIDDEGYWCEDGVQTDVKAVADEANYYTPEFDEDTMMWSWVEYDAEGEATGETIAMESVPAAVWTDGSLVIYGYNEETGEMETFEFSVFSEIKSINYIPELYVSGLETVEAFGLHSNVYTLMDPNSLGSFLTTNIFDLEYAINPTEASTDAFDFAFTSISVTTRAAGSGVLDVYTAARTDEGTLVVSADSDEDLEWLYETSGGMEPMLGAPGESSPIDMFALQATAKEGYVAETVTSDDYLQVSMTDLYGFVISNPQTYTENDLGADDRLYYAYIKTLVDAALEELGPCPYVWGDAAVTDAESVAWDKAYIDIFDGTDYAAGKAGTYYGMTLAELGAEFPFSFEDEYDAYVEAYPSVSVPNPLFPHATTMEIAIAATVVEPSADDLDPRTRVSLVYGESIDLRDYVETWWLGQDFVQGYVSQFEDDGIRPAHDENLDRFGPMEVGTTDAEALKVRDLYYTFELEKGVVLADDKTDQVTYVEIASDGYTLSTIRGISCIGKEPVVTVYAYVNDCAQPIAKAYIPVVIDETAKIVRSDYTLENTEFVFTYSDIYAVNNVTGLTVGDLTDDAVDFYELGSSKATASIESIDKGYAMPEILTWLSASDMLDDLETAVDEDGLLYVANGDLTQELFDEIYTPYQIVVLNDKGEWVDPSTSNELFGSYTNSQYKARAAEGVTVYAYTSEPTDGDNAQTENAKVYAMINEDVLNVNAGAVQYAVMYTLASSASAYDYPSTIYVPFSIEIVQPIEAYAYNNTIMYNADELTGEQALESQLTSTGDADNYYFAYGDVWGQKVGTTGAYSYEMSVNVEELFADKFKDGDGLFYADASFELYAKLNPDKTTEYFDDSNCYTSSKLDSTKQEAVDANLAAAKYAVTDYYYQNSYFDTDDTHVNENGTTVTKLSVDSTVTIDDYVVAYMSVWINLANGESFKAQDFAVVFKNPFYAEVDDVVLYEVTCDPSTDTFNTYIAQSGFFTGAAVNSDASVKAANTDYDVVAVTVYDVRTGKAVYGYGLGEDTSTVKEYMAGVTSYSDNYSYGNADYKLSTVKYTIPTGSNFGDDLGYIVTDASFATGNNGHVFQNRVYPVASWYNQGSEFVADQSASISVAYTIGGVFNVSATADVTVRKSGATREEDEKAAADAEAETETETETTTEE